MHECGRLRRAEEPASNPRSCRGGGRGPWGTQSPEADAHLGTGPDGAGLSHRVCTDSQWSMEFACCFPIAHLGPYPHPCTLPPGRRHIRLQVWWERRARALATALVAPPSTQHSASSVRHSLCRCHSARRGIMKEASEGWGCDARQGPTNLTDTTQLLAALPKIVIPIYP